MFFIMMLSSISSGERVILVDPKPVPWETPTRSKAGGEGRGEAGGHRRKRGVLGCRRRVTFPGGGVKTSSPTCRDLWRKHLQVRYDLA